jgi:thiol-disulfide isomerase/thioredoxin
MDMEKKSSSGEVMRMMAAIAMLAAAGCGGGSTAMKKIPTPETPMALGVVQRNVLSGPQFREFAVTYDTVQPADEFVQMIKQVKNDVEVLVFFGTWCGDSKREVPRFLKVADGAGIGNEKITLYGLDRTKKSPDGLTAQYGIERVPTFVFLKGGKEIGRITEYPKQSIEADMLFILAGSNAH